MLTWGEVLMNIGEMQRKLSLWAEQDKERKFYDLFRTICREDWLRLAYSYVAQNAGSKTAGCDGMDMNAFEADLEGNLVRLRTAS
jgi:RNA-directed DNA polymerase